MSDAYIDIVLEKARELIANQVKSISFEVYFKGNQHSPSLLKMKGIGSSCTSRGACRIFTGFLGNYFSWKCQSFQWILQWIISDPSHRRHFLNCRWSMDNTLINLTVNTKIYYNEITIRLPKLQNWQHTLGLIVAKLDTMQGLSLWTLVLMPVLQPLWTTYQFTWKHPCA